MLYAHPASTVAFSENSAAELKPCCAGDPNGPIKTLQQMSQEPSCGGLTDAAGDQHSWDTGILRLSHPLPDKTVTQICLRISHQVGTKTGGEIGL